MAHLKKLPMTLVMAQLAEWSLPTPVVRSSNPGISKTLNIPCVEKMKTK